MDAKAFEVRDSGTFLPVLAVKCEARNEAERYLLGRMGYGVMRAEQERYVLLCRLGADDKIHSDSGRWGDRTFAVAHEYIEQHFGELKAGSIVDVQFILGETKAPKVSESEEA